MIQMFDLVRKSSQRRSSAARSCSACEPRVRRAKEDWSYVILLEEIYTSLHYVNFHRRARLLQHQTCSASVLRLKNAFLRHLRGSRWAHLGLLLTDEVTAEATRQLKVARHNRPGFPVDGSQVGVLEHPNHVHLRSLLKGEKRLSLEHQVRVLPVCNLAHEPLERELPEQKVRCLLELLDLTQSLRPRTEASRLLLTSNVSGALASGLRCQSLPRRHAHVALNSRLLRAGHLNGFESGSATCDLSLEPK